MEKEFYKIVVFAELDRDNIQSAPKSGGFAFKIPKILHEGSFFDDDGSPSEMSSFFISKMLVEALMANIHASHKKGQIDSSEHFRDVIDRMEDLFVTNFDIAFDDKIPERFKK